MKGGVRISKQHICIAQEPLFGKGKKEAGSCTIFEPRAALYIPPRLMYHGRVMKKTLYLYLIKEITAPFLLGMGVFTLVLLMGKLLRLAEMVIAKGVPLGDILRLVLSMLPSFCLVTIPMAFLLAVLLAFGRLSADSEVTAMKACGVSLYGMLPPVLAFAVAAYLATMFVTLFALPWGNVSFKRLMYDIVETRATLNIKERVFNDEFRGVVMYVDRFDRQERRLSGVLVQDERNADEPSTIFAKSGIIATDPERKVIRLRLQDGDIHRAIGKTGYRLVEFAAYDLALDLSRASAGVKRSEGEMTLAELRERITHSEEGVGKRTLLLEFHKRFSLPFACFVFALVGVPLGVQNRRSGKGSGFSLAIAILLLFYILLSAGENLGEKGILPAAVAIWLPNLLFLLMGVRLFANAAAEKRPFLFTIWPALAGWARGVGGRP